MMMTMIGSLALPDDVLGQVTSFENTCGSSASAVGNCSAAIGDSAYAGGNNSISLGYSSRATNSHSGAFGVQTDASGDRAMAVGPYAVATGQLSCAFGNRVTAGAAQSTAIGLGVSTASGASNSFVMGNGSLQNGTSYSMMFVMNSDVPTFYMSNAGGASGSFSKIGIATTSPESLFHVRDSIRLGLTGSAPGTLIFNNSAGNTVAINTPASMSDQIYTLPTAEGVDGDVLIYTTGGQLTWGSGGTATDDWRLAGNNNATASSKLGTLNNQHLKVYANNAERMRVQTDGNVGIGTTAAIGTLHLDNAADSSHTELVIERSGNGAEANLRFNVGSNKRARIGLPTDAFDNDLYYDVLQNNKDHIFRVNFSGNTDYEVMRIEGQYANVGIGEDTVAAKLHVMCEPNQSGSAIISRFGIQGIDEPMFLQVANQEFSSSLFAPIVQGTTNGTGKPGFMFRGMVDVDATDTGIQPVVQFQARKNESDSSNVKIRVRPLFQFSNNTTPLVTIVSDSTGNAGRTGIGTTTPSGTLHVNGQTYVADIPAGSGAVVYWNSGTGLLNDGTSSSMHFKEDVEDLNFDMEAFLSLRPVSFKWKELYGGTSDVGFIAQETENAFAPLCEMRYAKTYFPDGSILRDSLNLPVHDTTQLEAYGVKYHKLPVYLFALARKQQQEIDALTQLVEQLADQINNCCSSNGSMKMTGDSDSEVKLLDSKSEFVLLRNDPNPFLDYTDIKYDNTGCYDCELIITDIQGRILKRISIRDDAGTVRIYSSEIGLGIYNYTLLQEGQVVGNGRMVSSK
jgi:hypothetical protein